MPPWHALCWCNLLENLDQQDHRTNLCKKVRSYSDGRCNPPHYSIMLLAARLQIWNEKVGYNFCSASRASRTPAARLLRFRCWVIRVQLGLLRTALHISASAAESFSTKQQRHSFSHRLKSSLTSSTRKSQRVPWASTCGRANENGSIRRKASWRSRSCCMVWAGLRCSEFVRSWASQPCCQATLSVTKDIWIENTLAARY